LGNLKTFCQIAGENDHSLGLDKNGLVWGWGNNVYGQLGINSINSKNTPVSILGGLKTFCQIAAGYYHSLGIDKNGLVWGWGNNAYGQIGIGNYLNRYIPHNINGINKTFSQIAAGYYHSLGIDKNGLVWSWGYGSLGQLGDNSTTSRRTPVSILGNKKTFCQIAGGSTHSLGIDKNGLVWGWGYNGRGQLGNNSTTSKNTPVSILGGLKTFCQIDGGGSHSFGIDKNGLVWGWGYNNKGQIGDNSVTSRRTPVSILGGLKTFCQIDGGNLHSLGLDKNGLVWGWGYNNKGQLGDNSVTSRRTPVSILGGLKTFCQIAGGEFHSLGIDKNGLVWSWGNNAYGQLGNNSTTSRRTPVSLLGGLKTFFQIAVGTDHSLGLDKNGLVWSWGYNSKGQLGDDSVTTKTSPVSILGNLKTFCQIAAGRYHSLGIDKNGLIWGWGDNDYYQLGIENTFTPIMISYI
jgi:alpha-tubulin suppressor-like RCC1 family protein